jgi:hypothetical protein
MKIIIGIAAVLVVLVVFFVLKSKRDRAIAEKEKGQALGEWTVYYDVAGQRIGLRASFGEEHLLRYLIFRLHDLFSYNAGLRDEQQRLADALTAAARGQGVHWSFQFPPDEAECFHAYNSPQGTLYKFFEGTLFEGAITQPRFIGGDAVEKQKGLVGECIAIAGHLAQRSPAAVSAAVDALVTAQMSEGDAATGPRFWRRATLALRSAPAAG